MAVVAKKFIKLGTGSDELSGSDIEANRVASNYTETDSSVKGHLDGIDEQLGVATVSGDIGHTSFSLANNQSSFVDVTGLSFSNAVTRSAEVVYSVKIDATADLFEHGNLRLVQLGSDWSISRMFDGNESLIELDITAAGQVQYKSANYTGFSSGTIKFRAITTTV